MKRITVQLPADLLTKIERDAKTEERDISKQIRYVLQMHYNPKKKEGER